MKTDEQIGAEAALKAHNKILKEAKAVKLTTRLVLQRLKEGLDAKENKVFYDKDRGKCILSPDLINWATRSKSIDQAMAIFNMAPKENDFEDDYPVTPVRVIIEVKDGRKGASQ